VVVELVVQQGKQQIMVVQDLVERVRVQQEEQQGLMEQR
jgi:hypothetical protein